MTRQTDGRGAVATPPGEPPINLAERHGKVIDVHTPRSTIKDLDRLLARQVPFLNE